MTTSPFPLLRKEGSIVRMLRYFHAAVSPLSGREYPPNPDSAPAADSEPQLTPDNFSQLVLYVGQEPLRMAHELMLDQRLTFSYPLVDVCVLDAETLLESDNPGAILFGFLAKKSCSNTELNAIIERLKSLSSHEDLRNELLADLYFISRLRGLQLEISTIIGEEQMKIIIPENLKSTDYLYINGKKEGREEAKIETALVFIRSGLVSLEAVTQTLELTPEEIAAIEALLKQCSNGKESNGADQ